MNQTLGSKPARHLTAAAPTFLTLPPYNTVPRVVATPPPTHIHYKIISLLLHNQIFATLMNHNVNTWYSRYGVWDGNGLRTEALRKDRILGLERWCLKALAALPKDLSLIPSIHSPGDPVPSSDMAEMEHLSLQASLLVSLFTHQDSVMGTPP